MWLLCFFVCSLPKDLELETTELDLSATYLSIDSTFFLLDTLRRDLRTASMFVPVFLLSYGALHASALSIPRLPQVNHFLGIDHGQQPQQPLQNTLDAWIAREEAVALDNLLANVAPGGRNVQGKGIKDGTVIASPSQRHPDYWFQCGYPATPTYNPDINKPKKGSETLQ